MGSEMCIRDRPRFDRYGATLRTPATLRHHVPNSCVRWVRRTARLCPKPRATTNNKSTMFVVAGALTLITMSQTCRNQQGQWDCPQDQCHGMDSRFCEQPDNRCWWQYDSPDGCYDVQDGERPKDGNGHRCIYGKAQGPCDAPISPGAGLGLQLGLGIGIPFVVCCCIGSWAIRRHLKRRGGEGSSSGQLSSTRAADV